MSDVGVFMVTEWGAGYFMVKEVAEGRKPKDGRDVASFGSIAPLGAGADKRAEAHVAHLTSEHADGRVPQSFCGTLKEGRTPCDHERVALPEMLTAAQRGALVFCRKHVGSFGIPLSDANAAWLAKQEAKS